MSIFHSIDQGTPIKKKQNIFALIDEEKAGLPATEENIRKTASSIYDISAKEKAARQAEELKTEESDVEKQTLPEEGGFLSRTSVDLKKRGSNILNQFTKDPIGKTIKELPGKLAISVGQVAGGINDIGMETGKSAYKNLAPEFVKYGLSESGKAILNTRVGEIGLEAIKKGQEEYGDFKRAYPDAALALEGIGNLVTAPFTTKGGRAVVSGGKAAGKETVDIARDIAKTIVPDTPEMITRKMNKVVEKGMVKVRPSVKYQRTPSMRNEFYSDSGKAIEGIIKNKGRIILKNADTGEDIIGQLPETLQQFSDAIDQNKKYFFKKYDDIAQMAEVDGAQVSLDPIVKDLNKIARDKVLNLKSPETAKYASTLAERFVEKPPDETINAGFRMGGIKIPQKTPVIPKLLSPSDAQDLVKEFNADLKAFYSNPSYPSAGKARIDAAVVSHLRKLTDAAITKYEGPGWKELRNEYGALKSIEDAVNHRVAIDMRKNTKGLLDFADLGTTYAALTGILTANPAVFTSAIGMMGLKRYYKTLNDPNYHIKNMFKDVESLKDVRANIGKPKSKVGQYLANQRNKDPLGIRD